MAEGVRVQQPLRIKAVLEAVGRNNGSIEITNEEDILPGRNRLAGLGFYVEPTSAIVWSVLNKRISELTDPIVVILTGSGCKYE